jgi:hypothetical protein
MSSGLIPRLIIPEHCEKIVHINRYIIGVTVPIANSFFAQWILSSLRPPVDKQMGVDRLQGCC